MVHLLYIGRVHIGTLSPHTLDGTPSPAALKKPPRMSTRHDRGAHFRRNGTANRIPVYANARVPRGCNPYVGRAEVTFSVERTRNSQRRRRNALAQVEVGTRLRSRPIRAGLRAGTGMHSGGVASSRKKTSRRYPSFVLNWLSLRN